MKIGKFYKTNKKHIQLVSGLLLLSYGFDRVSLLVLWIFPHVPGAQNDFVYISFFYFLVFILVVGMLLVHFSLRNYGLNTLGLLILGWAVLISFALVLITTISVLGLLLFS